MTLTYVSIRLSLIIMVIVTETTDRPFATSVFSKRSFIRGTDRPEEEPDTSDPNNSREENRLGDGRRRKNDMTQASVKRTSYDRSMATTPESLEVAYSPEIPYAQEATYAPQVAYVPPGNQYRSASRPVRPNPSNILRVERPRTQILPEPLEAVFTVRDMPPDARESPRQNGSHFSWRPPTRDSAYSQQRPSEVHTDAGTRRQDEVSAVSLGRRSILEPASLPPMMPLPPMPVQRMSQDMTASAAPPLPSSEPEDLATESQPDIPAPAPNSPTSPDGPYPSQTLGEVTSPAEPQAAQPSLAQLLSALSTRAAARRRNSLIVRQADLAPQRQSIDITQLASNADDNMATMLFQQPEEAETVKIPRPSTAPRDLVSADGAPSALRAHALSRVRSTATSGTIAMMLEQSPDFDLPVQAPRLTTTRRDLVSEDGAPLALRAHPFQRSNTDEPRSVRNFSRPRTRIARADDSDDDATDASLTDDDQSKAPRSRARSGRRGTSAERGARGADRIRTKGLAGRQVRRSRSVPSLMENPRSRNNNLEVGSQLEGSNVETGDRGRSTTREKPVQAPRFSPFPKTPDPDRKIKGLGQGSTKRRDERIARWREEVQHDDARPLDDAVVPRTRETQDFVQAQRREAAQRLG